MDPSSNTAVVTRFAPSPTGFLHIGGVRTALFAYLFAKKAGGTFILRIEDTDKAREVEGSVQHIQDSLRWLGIEWMYGPDSETTPFGSCLQSERLDLYKRYATELVAAGHAYPDPFTAEQVNEFREQAKTAGRPFLFRDHRPKTFAEWDESQPLRFKIPEIKRYEWQDTVRGTLSAGEEMLDDFIIMKADGFPTYNFAHVIDDHEMGVTHVMRGEEFIASTPKFLALMDALEIPHPQFVTLPPIMGPDGKKKLSKRDGAKDLFQYRTDGYLPEALRNFLALIGWNPGGDRELFFDFEELVAAFSLEKIQKSGGAFNEEKLKWMNREFLSHRSPEERAAYFAAALPETLSESPQYDPERVTRLTETALERVHNQVEITEAANSGKYDWAFAAPKYDPSLLQWKHDDSVTAALPRLRKAAELLADTDFATPDTIKAALWPYAEETGKGEVLWPLRVALSGRERSPDPFTLAYILGQDETLARIATACDKIGE